MLNEEHGFPLQEPLHVSFDSTVFKPLSKSANVRTCDIVPPYEKLAKGVVGGDFFAKSCSRNCRKARGEGHFANRKARFSSRSSKAPPSTALGGARAFRSLPFAAPIKP